MKKMDKFKVKVTNKKQIITFLVVLFIVGLIAGSLFTIILNENDANMVKESINSFINNIKNNKLNYNSALINSCTSNILSILLIWLLGISIIGIPIIVFLYFSKSFMLGFSISSIISIYKTKGFFIALGYVFPAHIISILVYTLLLIYALRMSLYLLKAILFRKTIDFKIIIKRYLLILLICIIGSVIASLLEVYLMPNLIKIIINF